MQTTVQYVTIRVFHNAKKVLRHNRLPPSPRFARPSQGEGDFGLPSLWVGRPQAGEGRQLILTRSDKQSLSKYHPQKAVQKCSAFFY